MSGRIRHKPTACGDVPLVNLWVVGHSRSPIAQPSSLYLQMMLGLSFANSKQALCCFIRFVASPKLSPPVDWGWTGDTVSTFAASAGGGAVAGTTGAAAGAGVGESGTAILISSVPVAAKGGALSWRFLIHA